MYAAISMKHENTLFLLASDPEDGGNISSKKLVPVYQTTLHDISEELHLHFYKYLEKVCL